MPNLGPYSPQVAVNTDYLARLTSTIGDAVPGLVQTIDFLPSGTASLDIDVVVSDKCEVIDVIVRKDGAGAANTVTIKNGSTAITNAMAAAVDKTLTRATTIDTASNVIAAGGTLRCTNTFAAGTVNALVSVLVVVRP